MRPGPSAERPVSGVPRPPGRLVDRRLAARVTVTRRYLVLAVAVGVGATAAIIVQAVLLASVVADVMLHHAPLSAVTPRLVGLAAAFCARALFLYAGEVSAQRVSATVTSTLRRSLLRQALDLGPSWLADQRTGELSLTATRGIAALDVYFGRYLPQAVLAVLAPAILLVFVAVADWPSALILLALLALIPVTMVHFGRRAADATNRQWRRLSSLSARYLELIQGLSTLRAFNRTDLGRREVTEATDGLRTSTLATLRVAFLSALAIELLAGLGTGLVAMVLGLRLLHGTVALASALAVLLVSPEVFLPLRRAGAEFHASAEGQAAAQRILDLLDDGATPSGGPATPLGPAPDPAHDPVWLRQVEVAHPGRPGPTLGRVDLELAPGERVAIVGPSGVGKSTVLSVLLGFRRPDRGHVGAGPTDLAGVDPAAWRRRITWVPQRPHLLRATLGENLRLGHPEADDEAVAWALEATGLDDLVAQLPSGLDTPVGEGGLSLSSGERQRVAIARAVLRDAPLVLLDEPTAHLDERAAARLADALAPWLEGRTVLVAGHRADLVAHPDRVLSLGADGRLRPVPVPGRPGAGAGPVVVGR
ncbi:MAG TPA: thiol reductant ABC exporter subunit CydD [Acidimicrobiales bacterium]|nr:thiol reductant ABC exporter subunit CydD [Acidimicrobiales bacterium]